MTALPAWLVRLSACTVWSSGGQTNIYINGYCLLLPLMNAQYTAKATTNPTNHE